MVKQCQHGGSVGVLDQDQPPWAFTERAVPQARDLRDLDRGGAPVAGPPSHSEITKETRIDRLAELWLTEKADEVRPQTLDHYQTSLRRAILPELGALRLREVTVSRLDRFLKALAATRPASAGAARTVLSQMMAMAVRHDALDTNPVRDLARHRKPRRHVRALHIDDLPQIRAAIRSWHTAQAHKPGPRHASDLADIVDPLLATGARIGEVLALRWADLDTTRARLTFSGTIVYLKGRGYHRQEWTKTEAGYRINVLPRFAIMVLLRRHATASPNPDDPIFPPATAPGSPPTTYVASGAKPARSPASTG